MLRLTEKGFLEMTGSPHGLLPARSEADPYESIGGVGCSELPPGQRSVFCEVRCPQPWTMLTETLCSSRQDAWELEKHSLSSRLRRVGTGMGSPPHGPERPRAAPGQGGSKMLPRAAMPGTWLESLTLLRVGKSTFHLRVQSLGPGPPAEASTSPETS